MALNLNCSPPEFKQGDLDGTVRSLCSYTRVLQENLNFLLTQIQKSLEEKKEV